MIFYLILGLVNFCAAGFNVWTYTKFRRTSPVWSRNSTLGAILFSTSVGIWMLYKAFNQ